MKATLIWLCIYCLSLKIGAEEMLFNLAKSHEGWLGEFADYPVGEEAFYELAWGWGEEGVFLSGNNHSDDLFMCLKKELSGFSPNSEYTLNFKVGLLTNVPTGLYGIGGSPGESVFVKVGASTNEPLKVISNNYYRMNIDIGSQSQGGVNGEVIGNLANSLVDPLCPCYTLKLLCQKGSLKVKTDTKGRFWILVGTDSGFEGRTFYYISQITLSLKK